MKAFISEKGVLSIWPETELEAFAIQCWSGRNVRHDAPMPLGAGEIHFAGDEWMSVRDMVFVGNVSEAMPT